ncbi:hypothetical protein D1007_35253 [Hordeum vulgare]|nr:hypothetical protein D1007_35253 [Hordeum vulgare]
MEQDVDLNDASRDPTSSSIVSHFFFMAKASKVSPTLNPNISLDDDDNDEYDDNDEECDNIASLKLKGEMIFISLYKNKLACSNFMEIMSIATHVKKYIEELEAHHEDHEATIETMEGHERDYADEIAELSQALENEQTTKESLEETFGLALSRLKESHDRALEWTGTASVGRQGGKGSFLDHATASRAAASGNPVDRGGRGSRGRGRWGRGLGRRSATPASPPSPGLGGHSDGTALEFVVELHGVPRGHLHLPRPFASAMEAARRPVLWLRADDFSHGAMQVRVEYLKRHSMLLGRG